MKKIIWLEEYSVEIEEFDFHHKRIFALIDEVRELLLDEEGKDKMEILSQLYDYGAYHLDREEELFSEYDYPDVKKHKKYHVQYKEVVGKYIEDCKQGKCDIKKLVEFLEKWWINHILREDKKYTKFFHDKGVY